MAKTRAQLKEINDERKFWEGLGKRLGLGTLIGWTFKHSATFNKDGLCLSVEGGVFVVLNELDIRIAELEDQLRLANIDAANALAERNDMEAEVEQLSADIGSAICARDAYQSETILIARLRAETEADNERLKTAMKNYSGHLGTCTCCDGFECDCGFSELWNELFPEKPAEAGEGENDGN